MAVINKKKNIAVINKKNTSKRTSTSPKKTSKRTSTSLKKTSINTSNKSIISTFLNKGKEYLKNADKATLAKSAVAGIFLINLPEVFFLYVS